MIKGDKKLEVRKLKDKTVCAKTRLFEISLRLEEIGAIREARNLYTIVEKLEAWQNK